VLQSRICFSYEVADYFTNYFMYSYIFFVLSNGGMHETDGFEKYVEESCTGGTGVRAVCGVGLRPLTR
jgi:hypothetical protein